MNNLECEHNIERRRNPENVEIGVGSSPVVHGIFNREDHDLCDRKRKKRGKIFVQSAPVHDDRNYRLKDRLRDP